MDYHSYVRKLESCDYNVLPIKTGMYVFKYVHMNVHESFKYVHMNVQDYNALPIKTGMYVFKYVHMNVHESM